MKFRVHALRKKKTSRKKIFISIFLPLFLCCLFFLSQELYYQYALRQSFPESRQSFPFVISEGALPKEIAFQLKEEEFINSSWAFLRYVKRSADAEKFQAGRFYLHKNMSFPKLSELLTRASINEISIVIPEGFTNADIDERLSQKGLIQPGEFIECIQSCNFSQFPFLPKDPQLREGFFFPDTYFLIPERFHIETFAKRLLSTFDQKTKTTFGTAQRNGWEILKMASIIEKESFDSSERPIVAGILWKRFDNGWMLGADATTRYITGKKTAPLTVDDLKTKSPWNTRSSRGLPPGAICNPGISAIKAAATPENTPYWFYLHGEDGTIHYAKTSEEHERNKEKYL